MPPGVPQVTCRYCGHVIHVEHRKPPPVVAQFAPHTVYIDPNAAKAARNVGLIIALVTLIPILIPIAIGVVPWMMRKMKPYPVACGTNGDIEISGNYETTGPIVTSVGHNCKLHINDSKLKGSVLFKSDASNVELTLENVTIETTDVVFDFGAVDLLITAFLEGTVRVGGMLRAASPEQRDRIRTHVEGALAPYRRGESYSVSAPIKVASGAKAA